MSWLVYMALNVLEGFIIGGSFALGFYVVKRLFSNVVTKYTIHQINKKMKGG